MLFNSPIFIFVFLPVTLGVYYFLGRQSPRPAQIWLIVASLFYYGWWNPAYLGLIGGLLAANYALGQQLTRHRSPFLLGFGLALNLSALGYFKYANFFVDNVNTVTHAGWTLEKIILPLGISFFTFQKIAYLVDAYQGKVKSTNFADFCLFVLFFPQLIAGPIVHHSDIIPQFRKAGTYRFDWDRLARGLSWFSLGLFKKVIVADGMGAYANKAFAAFASGHGTSTLQAWSGALSYTLQLYFDFSGYSEMAIGLALMFGISLPLNFNSPYQALSIIDFWRHWHMTLSRFLRDYVYIPLGGNRCSRARHSFNLFATMVIGGIWHGAGWTFLIWGALHGLALLLNHAWLKFFPAERASWARKILSGALTFVFIVVTWVIFRSNDLTSALHFLHALFWPTPAPLGFPEIVKARALVWSTLLLLVVWFGPNASRLFGKPILAVSETPVLVALWRPHWTWAVLLGLAFAACVLSLSQVSEFLYFQF